MLLPFGPLAPAATTSPLRALLDLLLGEAGIAILIGGAIGLYILWYLRGRDRPAVFAADYLREPPGDLHPGLVGTLLDEHANAHDVVATLIHLGGRGALAFTPIAAPGARPHDYRIRLLRRDLPLSRVEALLIDLLFRPAEGQRRQSVALSALRPEFLAAVPRFKVALYEEVVAAGFFVASPRETRRRYWLAGIWTITLALVIGLPLAALTRLPLLLAPVTALAIVGLALCRLARAMPAKTARGVEEAARWRAFRRYLGNLRRYEDVAPAAAIANRYLPYAVTFGLARGWREAFTAAGAPIPAWYTADTVELVPGPTASGPRPGRRERRPRHHLPSDPRLPETGGGISIDAGDLADLGGVADAAGSAVSAVAHVAGSIDLSAASDVGGAALEAASEGLGGLLDLASSIFDW